ncbi:MAG: hypothetical protein J6M02_07245 [Clostridia bacterium]|nr:hypothetical protein [Clostridia bacterium]
MTEELKPQIIKMAKTLNPFQTYCTEVGFFRCSSDIVDAVGDEVSKQLEPFSVMYELRRKEDGFALDFEIRLRW